MSNRFLMKCLAVCVLILNCQWMIAQKVTLDRVEPGNWWVGMKNDQLQLMVYGKNIGQTQPEINYSGVNLVKVHHADSPDYLFLDLTITPDTRPGTFPIKFRQNKKEVAHYNYSLKQRTPRIQSPVNGSDVIYLITPDRFRNGDPANDQVEGLKEKANRENPDGRHGGDLAGIISSVGYFQDLGVTTLWLNPVLENNMTEVSYHGYSTTDYYKLDPRYGSNEMYRQLADTLHKKDMKLIMDMIFNHCGLEHWWMTNLPFKDWIHNYPGYEITNHALASISDPHGTEADRSLLNRGWFVPSMPDLNQENPFMATYLIQNSIWWIEYAGLDGIRMDTYPYNNKEMMKTWAERVYAEYPNFYLLGETWVDNSAQESFWAAQTDQEKGNYNSKLSSITDFPLCFALHNAFKQGGDIIEVYKVISKDFLYDRSETNTIFADNHDMDRFYYTIGQDMDRFKNAMTLLLTTRGVPQLYYGGEILMHGHGPHGILREDFPGGWKGDNYNAFKREGRTAEQNEAFDHLQKLLKWRKTSKAIQEGSLTHFVPYNNVYVYRRKAGAESVLVIINNKPETLSLDMTRYQEVLKGYTGASDILSGEELYDLRKISLKPNSSRVLHLKPDIHQSK